MTSAQTGVLKAQTQEVKSVTAASLPRLDADAVVAALRRAAENGELGRAARQADAGTLEDEDGDGRAAAPRAGSGVAQELIARDQRRGALHA